MDTVLIVLGTIGLGAILISVYVFTVAARHYVSDDDQEVRNTEDGPFGKTVEGRQGGDRRRSRPVKFPLTIEGSMVLEDRRRSSDRRSDIV